MFNVYRTDMETELACLYVKEMQGREVDQSRVARLEQELSDDVVANAQKVAFRAWQMIEE